MEIEKYTIKPADMEGKGVSPQPNPMELPVDQAKAVFDQLTKEVTVPKFNAFVSAFANVDLTSDADKPISTATQAALDLKVDKELKTGSGSAYKVLSDNNYDDGEKEKVQQNTANRHNHGNQDTLDKVTAQHLIQIAENTTNRHNHGNQDTLDKVTAQHLTQIAENTTNRHNHANKSTLEKVTEALLDNILYKNNTEPYEPKGMYQPATMKYVDDKVVAIGAADMTKAIYDTDGKATDIFKYTDAAVRTAVSGSMKQPVYDPSGKATDIFTYADQAAWVLDSATKTYYRWGVENGSLYLEEITKEGGA